MERIPGGKARGGRCPRNVDKAELAQGIKVELEHTNDRRVAREIACDHLTEDGRYYSKLATIHLDGGRRRRARISAAAPEWVVYRMQKSDALRWDSKAVMSAGDGTALFAFPKGFDVPAGPGRSLVWRGTAPYGTDALDRAAAAAVVRDRPLRGPAAPTFTVYVRNETTGHARWEGTFASQAEAQAHADAKAGQSRKFTTFEVWTGTPRAAHKRVVGTERRGLHGAPVGGRRRRAVAPTTPALPTLAEAEHAEWVAAQAVTAALRSRDAAAITRAKAAHADAVEATMQAWWRLPAATQARLRETGDGPPDLDPETRAERAAAFKTRRPGLRGPGARGR